MEFRGRGTKCIYRHLICLSFTRAQQIGSRVPVTPLWNVPLPLFSLPHLSPSFFVYRGGSDKIRSAASREGGLPDTRHATQLQGSRDPGCWELVILHVGHGLTNAVDCPYVHAWTIWYPLSGCGLFVPCRSGYQPGKYIVRDMIQNIICSIFFIYERVNVY